MDAGPLMTSRWHRWSLKEASITSNTKMMTKRHQQRFQTSPQTVQYLFLVSSYINILKQFDFGGFLFYTRSLRSELWKFSSLMFSQRRDMLSSSVLQHTCRLTYCRCLFEHHVITVTYADLFSSTRSFGNSHRRSSPLQSHLTWPLGSLCFPRWSPSSPLTPSWPLSTSSYDPGDKLDEVNLLGFLPTVLLT